MGGSLEAYAARELTELVATDDELSRLAVDVAEASLGGNDPVEPTGLYR